MIDTRPLWLRALLAHGRIVRRSARAPQSLLRATQPLTNSQFVDFVRALVGLKPLYHTPRPESAASYVRLETLRRAADPDCDRCGGSGYFDGERLDMRCPCTGLPQREQRSRGPLRVNRDFARVRR